MSPSEFAAITRNVIRTQGFAEFLPVACYPERRDIRTLAGAPSGSGLEAIATKWATGLATPGEEFLVAFKFSSTEFKVIRFADGHNEHQIFAAEQA